MQRNALKLPMVLIFLFSTLLSAVGAFGQAEAGTISGTVRDSSGAVLMGATVTVTNLATSATRTTQSGNVGQYSVPGLTPGNYEVTIGSQNFSTFKTRVEVTVGGIATVDAQLTVGTSSTVVEVVAGTATQVNTESQEVSQLIDTQQMAQLPSLTRNPYDFVAVSGNISNGDNTTNNANSGQNTTPRGVGFSINGQRESGTEILLDGVENIDLFGAGIGQLTPVDSVQEYRVITNNFSSEYGRASGGIVNLTTKSGTNSFHGDVWEYNRLSAYTANTYNNDANGLPKGAYTRNQFGFNVGGPAVKDKLFFFASTEWTRVRSNSSQSEAILTPQFIATLPSNAQGYFQAYGQTKYNIASTVSAADVQAVAKSSGAFGTFAAANPTFPVMGIVNFSAPFDAGGGAPENTYDINTRVDYNLSEKTQMFFRYARYNEIDFLGADYFSVYPQYDEGGTFKQSSYLYSLSHAFNVNLFSNTKVSFTRFNNFNSYDTAQQNVPMLFIGAGTSVNAALIQMPGLDNVAPGLGGLPYGGPQNTIQFEQDLSWTKGRHNLKFGGQFTYIQLNKAYGAYAQAVELGGDTLDAGLDNLIGTGGVSQIAQYEAAVDPNGVYPCSRDVTGAYVVTSSCEVTPPLTSPNFARSYRYKDWALYAQDSFRITPRLTLNYGTRYEHFGVQHNNDGNLDSNFYYGTGSNYYESVRNGSVQIADKSSTGGLWAPDWGTIAPRLGFAYDVFGDGKTSLRGGFGVSYERNFGNVTFNAIQNVPNYAVLVYDGPIPLTNNNLGPFGTAGPAVALPNTSLRQPAPNINTAQTQFWSLAVERQLARGTVLEIGYNAAHGVHLYDIRPSNQRGGGNVYLGDPFPAATYNALNSPYYDRPNYQYSNINTRGSGGTSSYNALNIRFQTSNLHNTGLTLVANYTWAHSLDDLSSTFSDSAQGGSGYIGNLGYLDPNNPKLDWGSSDFDVPQRLALAPMWQTPWFKSGRGVPAQVLGGWSIAGIITARGGTPFSVFDYTYSLNGGAGYGVPRIIPATPVTAYKTGSPVAVGPNTFNILQVPGANDLTALSSALSYSCAPMIDPSTGDTVNAPATCMGLSDFGPFPAGMTHRNAFRGPGAWNADLVVAKKFKLTETVGLEFRAEGFDVFNHHNYYVDQSLLDVDNPAGTIGAPLEVTALKGGLNNIALGGNHDERRFGQFSLRISF